MSLADNITRKLELLEAALELKKSGLPSKVVTVCYSDDPDDIDEAERQVMERYGIKSREVLDAAGSKIQMGVYPWAKGRAIGITCNTDPKIPAVMREDALRVNNGKETQPIIGTKQQIEGFE